MRKGHAELFDCSSKQHLLGITDGGEARPADISAIGEVVHQVLRSGQLLEEGGIANARLEGGGCDRGRHDGRSYERKRRDGGEGKRSGDLSKKHTGRVEEEEEEEGEGEGGWKWRRRKR